MSTPPELAALAPAPSALNQRKAGKAPSAVLKSEGATARRGKLLRFRHEPARPAAPRVPAAKTSSPTPRRPAADPTPELPLAASPASDLMAPTAESGAPAIVALSPARESEVDATVAPVVDLATPSPLDSGADSPPKLPVTNMAKDLTAEPSYSAAARPATAPAGASADRQQQPPGSAVMPPAVAPTPAVSPRSLLKEAEEKLALLRDNREIFEWILEKQSGLRTEFVGFLKKDLREIDYVVSDINTKGDRGDFAANALELIKNTYIKHWERSFELISPENVLQQTSDEK